MRMAPWGYGSTTAPTATSETCQSTRDSRADNRTRQTERRSPRYIGGATPSLPTVTRPAASLPSAFLVAPNITGAPGFRSARSAGANVTIGALGGTTILLLPPLNERLSSRPAVASTVPLTVPLVIMLPG